MNIIRIGYTGPRTGMQPVQMRGVYWLLSRIRLEHDSDPGETLFEAHHGDCRGGDAEFHVIAVVLGYRTVAHPPDRDTYRAWCKADETRAPKPYLKRDWDIAGETGLLVAAPKDLRPVTAGSGTWTTTGYGLQLGRRVTVVSPDDGGLLDGNRFRGALGLAVMS